MIQLIYQSVSRFDEQSATFFEEIAKILQQSISYNLPRDLTGVLAFSGGRFVQILEGPDAEVDILYNRILRDQRHADIVQLSRHGCPKRSFGAWSMAYVGHGQGAGRIFDLISDRADPAHDGYHAAVRILAELVG